MRLQNIIIVLNNGRFCFCPENSNRDQLLKAKTVFKKRNIISWCFQYGTLEQLGTIDFYPGAPGYYGHDQPGCYDVFNIVSCSHHRSIEIFLSSIVTATCLAGKVKLSDWLHESAEVRKYYCIYPIQRSVTATRITFPRIVWTSFATQKLWPWATGGTPMKRTLASTRSTWRASRHFVNRQKLERPRK